MVLVICVCEVRESSSMRERKRGRELVGGPEYHDPKKAKFVASFKDVHCPEQLF